MADGTKIEWTDATWNVITGCSVISPGCTNCYAMRLAGTRLRHHPTREGLTINTKAGPVWNGQVRFNEQMLRQPLQWKRPRLIFVCAHADLFHENVPDEWIDRVFAVMALAQQHTFQVLTKRPARMQCYVNAVVSGERSIWQAARDAGLNAARLAGLMTSLGWGRFAAKRAPLPNVWLGTSVEDQARANERIPLLLSTPAAVRWLSMEPLLGPIDLRFIPVPHPTYSGVPAAVDALTGEIFDAGQSSLASGSALHWIVLGGESGSGARPMHPDWVRSLRDQCAAADVPFLFKQWGAWLPIEPDMIPHFKAQDGRLIERHEIPEMDGKSWSDALLYEGNDICVHHLVGKKAAGRFLDGVQHDGYPEVSRG